MQEESITEIEKISDNIVSKVKSMIQNIKDINRSSYSLCLVSIFMISFEGEKKFIQKYDYYLYLFNTLLSFFRVEELNTYNNNLFDIFVELLYETVGRRIISKKCNICYDVLDIEFFRAIFTSTHINMLLFSSSETHKNFFDLIEKEFHIYMNNLYGIIFRSSLSKEESIMIHFDYILRNEFSIYSLDYIFFEELYQFMVIEYETPINNNNIINIIYHNQNDNEYNNDGDNNDFEEEDIYS